MPPDYAGVCVRDVEKLYAHLHVLAIFINYLPRRSLPRFVLACSDCLLAFAFFLDSGSSLDFDFEFGLVFDFDLSVLFDFNLSLSLDFSSLCTMARASFARSLAAPTPAPSRSSRSSICCSGDLSDRSSAITSA